MTKSFDVKTAPLDRQIVRLQELETAAAVTEMEYAADPVVRANAGMPRQPAQDLTPEGMRLHRNWRAAANALDDFCVQAYNDSPHGYVRGQAARHIDAMILRVDTFGSVRRKRLHELLFLSSCGGQQAGYDFVFNAAFQDQPARPPSTSRHAMVVMDGFKLLKKPDRPGILPSGTDSLLSERGRAILARLTAEDGPASTAVQLQTPAPQTRTR